MALVGNRKREKGGKYFQGPSRNRGDHPGKVVIVMSLADRSLAMQSGEQIRARAGQAQFHRHRASGHEFGDALDQFVHALAVSAETETASGKCRRNAKSAEGSLTLSTLLKTTSICFVSAPRSPSTRMVVL